MGSRARVLVGAVLVSALAGCAGGGPPDRAGSTGAAPIPSVPTSAAPTDAASGPASPARTDPLVAQRPYELGVPAGYDPTVPTPLLLVLHGYGASGQVQATYWRLGPTAEREGFLLARPDGRTDSHGKRFWNATDACCDADGIGGDDVAYLMAVIDDVRTRYHVDDRRIYVAGHSNGGFMAHRLACEHGDRIAAVVSLVGATWIDRARCPAPGRTSVLQVHGDRDNVVRYAGGDRGDLVASYPSATETVATWAAANGCRGRLERSGAPLDIDAGIAGSETRVEAYAACPAGGAVELWTIERGRHIPAFGTAWSPALWSWLPPPQAVAAIVRACGSPAWFPRPPRCCSRSGSATTWSR